MRRATLRLRASDRSQQGHRFAGNKAAVKLCATRFHGDLRLSNIDDVTPSTGVVRFVDDSGVEREIDFIDQPYGLRAEDVQRTALPVEFVDEVRRRSGIKFKVMQPVLSMESRIHNTMGLPGYDTPHALNQARAAVRCAQHYLRELLDELGPDGERAVGKLNERIFRFALRDHHGRAVIQHGIDPFEAVLVEERLPEAFRLKRYPQMVEQLASARARMARPAGGG